MRQSDVFRTKARHRRKHKKSNTVGTYHVITRSSGEERRQAELFKEQLSVASNVRIITAVSWVWVHEHLNTDCHFDQHECLKFSTCIDNSRLCVRNLWYMQGMGECV